MINALLRDSTQGKSTTMLRVSRYFTSASRMSRGRANDVSQWISEGPCWRWREILSRSLFISKFPFLAAGNKLFTNDDNASGLPGVSRIETYGCPLNTFFIDVGTARMTDEGTGILCGVPPQWGKISHRTISTNSEAFRTYILPGGESICDKWDKREREKRRKRVRIFLF